MIPRSVLVPAFGLLFSAGLAAQTPSPAPSPAPAEAGTPRFPAVVEQVTVDVVVTDKKGVPIPGLTEADFQILEENKPQKIVGFESIEVPATASAVAPARPKISTNLAPEIRTGRSFVIVFDDIHLAPHQAQRAKGAVAEFLRTGVREGDRVSLVATGGGAWWTTRMEAGREELMALLKRLDGRHIPDTAPDRMSDYEAMRIHVYRDPQVEAAVSRRFVSEIGKFDEVVEQDGARVIVDPQAVLYLLGTEMDFKTDKLAAQFVFNNPNQKSACGCGESVLLTPASKDALEAH